MNILLIDNYDSFVYNIAQILLKSGNRVTTVENDALTSKHAESCDRVIVSPGPGNPENPGDRGNTVDILSESDKKVLGICFGHQLIGMLLGCRIRRAEKLMHGEIDRIRHHKTPLYAGVPEVFEAVRYHSLIVEPSERVIVDSLSTSDSTVMGLHSDDGRFWGIQFHPESHYTQYGEKIIANFLEV